MLPEDGVILDMTKTYRAELISAYKPEDINTVYLTFRTCDLPQPVYIYGACLTGTLPLGMTEDLLELEYPIGERFNLSIRATVFNGKTRYCTDDVIPKKPI